MALVSRDTMRAAALQRQALENETVPSALLLEVLKAYTDLKDRLTPRRKPTVVYVVVTPKGCDFAASKREARRRLAAWHESGVSRARIVEFVPRRAR